MVERKAVSQLLKLKQVLRLQGVGWAERELISVECRKSLNAAYESEKSRGSCG